MKIPSDNGYIVADKFKNLTHIDNILTFSKFIHAVVNNNLPYKAWQVGLGLNEYEVNILRVISRSVAGLRLFFPEYKRASKLHTHKHKQENIMISDPEKMHERIFVAYLLPNDDCAEMSDHLTGKHIQGMVLVEAARQMMLAVSEKYILAEIDKSNMYCVLGNIDIDFKGFVFPIETQVECRLQGLLARPGNKYKLNLSISFAQREKVCSTIDFTVSFYKKSFMENIETDMLGKTVISHDLQMKKAVNHA